MSMARDQLEEQILPSVLPHVVYDRVTQAWLLLLGEDLHYGYFLDPKEPLATATARLTEEMAQRAEIGSDCRVLDVGCGVGTPALMLAERYGCHVVGISTSEVGLAVASSRAQEKGLADRAVFELGDGTANGFPDETFDLVWVLESSHLMPRKDKLIAECARVLRPGGGLVLCDIIARSQINFTEVVRRLNIFRSLDTVFGRARMASLEEYKSLAERNRLKVVRSEDISNQVQPTFEWWRRNAYANREQVVELVGEAYWRCFVDCCNYLEQFWRQGEFGYGIMLAEKA